MLYVAKCQYEVAGQIRTNKFWKRNRGPTWSRERRVRSFVVVSVFIAALASATRLSAIHFSNLAMEEAASLFGPADSASDPFGSIVTNGSDDLVASSTSPPSELPLLDTRKADAGSGWFNGSSGHHHQAEGSLYPEYDWPSNDDAGGHYNSQPHYEGLTPSSFVYHQPLNAHVGDNLQYTAPQDGELAFTLERLWSHHMYEPEFSWPCVWDAAAIRAECHAVIVRAVLSSAIERWFVGRSHVIHLASACCPRACHIRPL